jgi:hypothetical protein
MAAPTSAAQKLYKTLASGAPPTHGLERQYRYKQLCNFVLGAEISTVQLTVALRDRVIDPKRKWEPLHLGLRLRNGDADIFRAPGFTLPHY